MATLRLESYDDNVLELPDLCLKCGAPSAVRKSKKFSWFPPWVWVLFFVCGLIPFAIVASIMTKRRRVEAPLCEEHKNHWIWRQLVIVGSLLALVGIVFASAFFMMDNQAGRGDDALFNILCGGSVMGLVVWIIAAAVLQYTSIRPSEITDTSITLVGVSDVFIQAYEDEWRPSPERLDERVSERWNQGKRRPHGERPSAEDADRIRRTKEDEGRRPPPDTYQEGTP